MTSIPAPAFERSEQDRVIAGVCGGLASALRVDATLVRLAFALLAIAGGAGILLYFALWAYSRGRARRAAGLVFAALLALLLAFGFSTGTVFGIALILLAGAISLRRGGSLRPGGTLVTIKADAQLPAAWHDIRTVAFVQESSRAQLTELAGLVDQGQLRPQVGAVYPLAQAAEAFSAKAAGGIPGRVILRP